jgi:surface antigen
MKPGHQRQWAEILNNARDLDLDYLTLDVEPDDRVGAPLPNRFKSRLRRMPGCLLATGIIWTAMSNPEQAQVWFASAKSGLEVVVSNAREIAERADRERAAPHPAMPKASAEAAQPIAPIEEAATPTQDDKASAGASEGLSTGTIGTAYAETPEPAVETQDKSPKRVHAIAAGLSPDLPNILLTRLSESDLKNAGYAVKTALAKTPDDASFAWPPKPSQQQALFEVRFVAGASQGCRRYIVTVTKERWSSTTAAMEKCGGAVLNAG